ncbi:unnamed protein product [Lasius platythorax]|uniref:Uncharacterized protein n=1 Tax=Lasius platythorax TaxID=488582 RepID=A0AAV2PD15_9HYME
MFDANRVTALNCLNCARLSEPPTPPSPTSPEINQPSSYYCQPSQEEFRELFHLVASRTRWIGFGDARL